MKTAHKGTAILWALAMTSACSSERGAPTVTPPAVGEANGADAAPASGDGEAVFFDGSVTFTRGSGTGSAEFTHARTMATIDLPTEQLTEPRQILGELGNRNAQGQFAFSQPCAASAYAVYLADTAGTPTDTVIPCSDHDDTLGFTEYDAVRLSPDGARVAVEPSLLTFSPRSTFVYSRTGTELARFEGYVSANWTVDGRLMLATGGLWVTDSNLDNLTRVDGGQIIAPMGTPTPHPDGSRVAFQYSGGLYQINLDGSGFGKLYENPRIAYAPVWSPDGQVLAFLLSNGTLQDPAIYFYDTRAEKTYVLPLAVFIFEANFDRYPFGPLSWNR